MQLTSLCDANYIVALENGGNGEFLNGRGNLVPSKLDIVKHHGVETRVVKGAARDDLDRAFLFSLDIGDSDLFVSLNLME